MEQDRLPSPLRFARQWTKTTAPSPLEYPSRHTGSATPSRGSRVPLTPSPDRVRRQPLELSFASASPSPPHRPAQRAPTSEQHPQPQLKTHSLVTSSSPPPPLGTAATGFTDADGKAFWRMQAQRLEATCASLMDELRSVYRLVNRQAASTTHEAAQSSDAAVLRERNEARVELAREREKNFLLRHRLRETEAEVDRLQQRLHNQHQAVSRYEDPRIRRHARLTSASPHRSPSSEEPPRHPSRHSTASSYLSSTISSSRREAPPSPAVPRRRSGTRPRLPSASPPSPSPRPHRGEATHPVSRQRRGDRGVAAPSHERALALLKELKLDARQRRATASATARGAPVQGSPPSRPRRRPPSRRLRADEARALLASLLSARSRSPSSTCSSSSRSPSSTESRPSEAVRRRAMLHDSTGEADDEERMSRGRNGHTAGPVRPSQRVTASPRRVFHSSLFGGSVVARAEECEGGPLPRRHPRDETPPRSTSCGLHDVPHRSAPLLSPTPPQRESDVDEGEDEDDDNIGGGDAVVNEPLRATLAARSLMDSLLGGACALAGPKVKTGDAAHRRASSGGDWTVWHPQDKQLH